MTTAGIDAAKVTGWFEEHAAAVEPPLSFTLITGGHSNLTFRVEDTKGTRWVLRRPPLGHVLATAHDMSREHRIVSALAPTDVPVPHLVGLCEDPEVNGAPFYVMDFVDGAILRSHAQAEPLDLAARSHAGDQVAEVLARIHDVDVDAVGLGDLGRKEAYLERQLKRWHRQWEQSKTRELPVVDTVHAELTARAPEQTAATIVHGDYRLDNCLVGPDGTITAVLDWELCTLGDPLADVGLLLVYWSQKGDEFAALGDAATTLDGFPSRTELAAAYAAASGRDLGNIDYYVAFGYWKLACILEGVYARYRAGVMGESGGFELFAQQVELLAQAAHTTIERMA